MCLDVTIIDCGIGNFKAVQRMFQAVDVDAELVSDPDGLQSPQRVVLPGVGAFDAGMAALNRGWRERLDELALERRVPVLGICLGAQLLCRRSEEGQADGLGWIAADVRRVDTGGDPKLKVPHMGWAEVTPARPNPLIGGEQGPERFYHAHSYRAVCDSPETELARATYGAPFTTAVQNGNIFGVQFHPEKSHKSGMALLSRFAALPC